MLFLGNYTREIKLKRVLRSWEKMAISKPKLTRLQIPYDKIQRNMSPSPNVCAIDDFGD